MTHDSYGNRLNVFHSIPYEIYSNYGENERIRNEQKRNDEQTDEVKLDESNENRDVNEEKKKKKTTRSTEKREPRVESRERILDSSG